METDWLDTLLNTKFFTSCDLHPTLQKNKFCIDCSVSFCKNCTVHDLHRQVHIRKYVYNDVVRVQDMEKYFRCSEIHTYKVNGEISVHINSRSHMNPKLPITKSTSPCEDCGRYVPNPHRFCSIACKIANKSNAVKTHQVSVNSKLKDQSIGTTISPSTDVGNTSNLSFKEKTSAETNASELESTLSIAEYTEETKASPSSSQPRKRRMKGTPHRSPLF